MRLRLVLLLVISVVAGAAWACSLNPQPLPPDTVDAGIDASLNAGPDAAGGVPDGAVPTGGDAAADGGEDAETDAGDAESDAAAPDASDAGEASDAGDDVVEAGDQ